MQTIDNDILLLRRLSGQGQITVLGPSMIQAKREVSNMRKAFPQANIRPHSWTFPEALAGYQDVLFIFLQHEPPAEIMRWVRPAMGQSIFLEDGYL